MGRFCPPKFNRDFVTSPEGIMKMLLILVGAFCWGLIYVGEVMAESNEAPEINDQVMFFSALTLPSWLLTLVSFLLFSFTKEEAILFKLDAGLNLIFGVLYIACVGYCATYEWFIWWCEDSLQVVDTGECPDPVLRNAGQNLAVVVLGSILAAGYCVAGIATIIRQKKKVIKYNQPVNSSPSPTDDNL